MILKTFFIKSMENKIPQKQDQKQDQQNIDEIIQLLIASNFFEKASNNLLEEASDNTINELKENFNNWIIQQKNLLKNSQEIELKEYILSQIEFTQIENAKYLKKKCTEIFSKELKPVLNMQIFSEIKKMQNNFQILYPYLINNLVLDAIKNFIALYKIKIDPKVNNEDFKNILFDLTPYINQRTLDKMTYDSGKFKSKYEKGTPEYEKEINEYKEETIIKITDILSIIKNYKPNNDY